jgi:DNA-binding protein H-NS
MARPKNLANMSYAELVAMKAQVESVMAEKQLSEKAELKQKLANLAQKGGFSLDELMGKARKATGKVAIKYRDPKNASNTWTGRGRMPRWMTAATKGGKAKKEDFLIS